MRGVFIFLALPVVWLFALSRTKAYGADLNSHYFNTSQRSIVSDSGGWFINCGSPEDSKDQRGIYLESDTNYADSGNISSVSPSLAGNGGAAAWEELRTLRSFPDGKRNCYTLRPTKQQNVSYLITALFLYGNYDGLGSPPAFELYVGTTLWAPVKIESAERVYFHDVVHTPRGSVIQVCVVDIGLGTPFISALQVRPLKRDSVYWTEPGKQLVLVNRYDCGGNRSAPPISRFGGDVYDRIWENDYVSKEEPNVVNTSQSFSVDNNEQAPSDVLKTAITPKNQLRQLSFQLIGDSNSTYLVYLHFAMVEQDPNPLHKTNFIVAFNNVTRGSYTLDNINPKVVHPKSPVQGPLNLSITSLDDCDDPPILNAMEIFQVVPVSELYTHPDDVNAMLDIKQAYKTEIHEAWQGDPCFPINPIFSWSRVQCNVSEKLPARVIYLNLSSVGLTGNISESISNLKAIKILDISYNNLTGSVPESLGHIDSLTELDLTENKLEGNMPSVLLEKSRNGTLVLRYSGSTDSGKNHNGKKTGIIVGSTMGSLTAVTIVIYAVMKSKNVFGVSTSIAERISTSGTTNPIGPEGKPQVESQGNIPQEQGAVSTEPPGSEIGPEQCSHEERTNDGKESQKSEADEKNSQEKEPKEGPKEEKEDDSRQRRPKVSIRKNERKNFKDSSKKNQRNSNSPWLQRFFRWTGILSASKLLKCFWGAESEETNKGKPEGEDAEDTQEPKNLTEERQNEEKDAIPPTQTEDKTENNGSSSSKKEEMMIKKSQSFFSKDENAVDPKQKDDETQNNASLSSRKGEMISNYPKTTPPLFDKRQQYSKTPKAIASSSTTSVDVTDPDFKRFIENFLSQHTRMAEIICDKLDSDFKPLDLQLPDSLRPTDQDVLHRGQSSTNANLSFSKKEQYNDTTDPKVGNPLENNDPPNDDMAPPNDDMAPPNDDNMAPPNDDMAPPNDDMTPDPTPQQQKDDIVDDNSESDLLSSAQKQSKFIRPSPAHKESQRKPGTLVTSHSAKQSKKATLSSTKATIDKTESSDNIDQDFKRIIEILFSDHTRMTQIISNRVDPNFKPQHLQLPSLLRRQTTGLRQVPPLTNDDSQNPFETPLEGNVPCPDSEQTNEESNILSLGQDLMKQGSRKTRVTMDSTTNLAMASTSSIVDPSLQRFVDRLLFEHTRMMNIICSKVDLDFVPQDLEPSNANTNIDPREDSTSSSQQLHDTEEDGVPPEAPSDKEIGN